MELESLRLDFLFTIFFLRSFSHFFFSIYRPTPFFQAPRNLRQFFLLHLNPFLKIPNPNHDLNQSKNPNPSSKSISQNPKPKSRSQMEQKSKPKNHDFSTGAPWVWRSRHWRNIFYCGFVFSILPSSSKSISQNPKPKSRSQSEQKLFFVGSWFMFSGQKLLVRIFWAKSFGGSSTWIFLIHLSRAPLGNRIFETRFATIK